MTRKIGIFTAIAVLILSTLACSFPLGIAATSPTETQTPKPAVAPPTVAPPTGAPSPTLKPQTEVSTLTPFPPVTMFTPTPVTGGGGGGGGVGTATLTVVNNSSQMIFYLYISPSTSSSWGNDQLGASTIPVGGNHVFPGITPGTYDLKAENSSHTVIQTWMGVTLNGSMTWTVTGGGGGGGTASLTVVNNSGQTIFYLYISPSTSSSWGNDQLGANTIPAGGTYTFTGITPGTYDLKAENSSHTVIQTWMGVSLTGSTTWTVTSSGGGGGGGGTATLTVVNNSGQTIFYLYISPSTSSSWGNDQLGASTIPTGGTYTFTGITPGTYDLKAENSSHTVIQTWMGVSLTGSTTWTVTSSGGGGGGGGTATLTVVNNSGQTIFYLYISPSTSSSWGSDQLGSSTIPAGGTYTFPGITPGTYDLKAENSSHTVIRTWMGVSLSGSVTWTVSP